MFASPTAKFLPGLVEYFSLPWDIGVKKAKELTFESRFIDAEEARELGFVNRVIAAEDLERETTNYALRVAENYPMTLRMAKLAANHAHDLQGYSAAMEAAFHNYMVMTANRGSARVEGVRRLGGVDLAVRGMRGERPGLEPTQEA